MDTPRAHPFEDVIVFCGECARYKVNADMDGVESSCARLDHKRIRFCKKAFLAYDCGRLSSNICRDFVPSPLSPHLQSIWKDYDSYEPFLPRDEVALEDSSFPGVIFFVSQSAFADGGFLADDGSIRWTRKQYYKARQLWTEFPDGTVVKGNCKSLEGLEDIDLVNHIPDEETLLKTMHELHWNVSAVGRHYGVSDNAVRKWCRKFDLPDKKGASHESDP